MTKICEVVLVFLLFQQHSPPVFSHSVVAAESIQQSQTADALHVLQVLDGTLIDVEAPYTLRSQDFKPKDLISFRVVNPVKVNGITVIAQGATATGRIEKSKRGGHFGKAGLF